MASSIRSFAHHNSFPLPFLPRTSSCFLILSTTLSSFDFAFVLGLISFSVAEIYEHAIYTVILSKKLLVQKDELHLLRNIGLSK